MQDLVRSGRYNREGGTDRREASGLTGWKEGQRQGQGQTWSRRREVKRLSGRGGTGAAGAAQNRVGWVGENRHRRGTGTSRGGARERRAGMPGNAREIDRAE